MKTLLLVGVPGCGKSTIVQEIIRHFPHLSIINYGDAMLREAAALGLSRDKLRSLPVAEQQKIGIAAAKNIHLQKGPLALIDTHALIRTPVGFCPGLPKEVLKILNPLACVWIECTPSLIIERRKNDPSRNRDEESEEELALHQELTRAYLSACSMETGAILCCIKNNTSSIETNAAPLLQLIKQLSPT